MIKRSPEFNEFKRKEFLGDALLKFAVGEIFCQKFPDFATHSHIPKMEAFVKNKTLTKVALRLGIEPFPEEIMEFTHDDGFVVKTQKPYANAVEAHIYDLYVIGGLPTVYDFIENQLFTDEAIKLVTSFFKNEYNKEGS